MFEPMNPSVEAQEKKTRNNNAKTSLKLDELPVGKSYQIPFGFMNENYLRVAVSKFARASEKGHFYRVIKHKDYGCFEIFHGFDPSIE